MGTSGFFKGEKKKKKKEEMEKNAGQIGNFYAPPSVEIVGKKKKKNW